MTSERGLNETPEQRAARIQAAKERAAAARAARESGDAPPAAPVAEAALQPETPVPTPDSPLPTPALDDRPRTAAGTLKRDPDEEKKAPPATPEERRARVEAAKAAAAAARAQKDASGGAVAPARAAIAVATGEPEADAGEEEPAAPGDGLARTAKGTLKRDPNAPKKEVPATPEERQARIAAAKAAAAAAKERAKTAPAAAAAAGAGPRLAGAAAGARGGAAAADQAAFRKAYEAVAAPLPNAGEQALRPVAAARAERPAPPNEFPLTEAAEAALAAFREAMDGVNVEFEVRTSPLDPVIVIGRADVYRVLERCKLDPRLAMQFLRCISGVDQMDEGIEVVYHLKSLTTKHALTVKTLLPPHDLVVDSVTPIWRGANWHERELMEMFGVFCAGHPDPRNLLLDEDMTIHPLLKAHPLQEVELRQGVNVF